MQDYYMHNKNEKGSIGYDFRLNEKILKGRYEATLDRYWDTNILYLHDCCSGRGTVTFCTSLATLLNMSTFLFVTMPVVRNFFLKLEKLLFPFSFENFPKKHTRYLTNIFTPLLLRRKRLNKSNVWV